MLPNMACAETLRRTRALGRRFSGLICRARDQYIEVAMGRTHSKHLSISVSLSLVPILRPDTTADQFWRRNTPSTEGET